MTSAHARQKPLLLQTAISIMARFTGVGLNFIVLILITRTLPVNEAGMMLMMMTLITGTALFSRLGVEQWIVRDVASLNKQESTQYIQSQHLQGAYGLVLLSSLAFMGAWLLSMPLLSQWLFDGEILFFWLQLSAAGILFFNVVLLNAAFMKATQYVTSSLLIQNALPAISFLVLLLGFWLIYRDGQNYLWLYTSSLGLAAVLSFFWLRPWWKQFININKATLQKLSPGTVLKASLPLAPISYIAFMMLWCDTLMTGLLLENQDVSYFSIAARLAFVVGIFLGALDATIYPRLLRISRQENKQPLQRLFWQSTGLVIAIITIVTLLLGLCGSWLLWVFKESYVEPALPSLLILLASQWVRAVSLTFSFMFIIARQTRFLNILLFLALVVNIFANLLFIPKYGIEGAASATLIANLVLTVGVIALFLRKRLLNSYD